MRQQHRFDPTSYPTAPTIPTRFSLSSCASHVFISGGEKTFGDHARTFSLHVLNFLPSLNGLSAKAIWLMDRVERDGCLPHERKEVCV